MARLSSRLLASVSAELRKIDSDAPGAMKKTIHGAFTYALCSKARWCRHEQLPEEWLGIFRAKCAWSSRMYEHVEPRWPARPATHGQIFHPVKVHPKLNGREFKRFKCAERFRKEGIPDALVTAKTLTEQSQTTTARSADERASDAETNHLGNRERESAPPRRASDNTGSAR